MKGTILTVLLAGSASASFGQPSFVGLGELSGGDVISVAASVSGDGTRVVGVSRTLTPNNPTPVWRPFVREHGSGIMRPLPVPEHCDGDAWARAISYDGSTICGSFGFRDSTDSVACAWRDEKLVMLSPLVHNDVTSFSNEAWGVSGDGLTIVGACLFPPSQAVAWEAFGIPLRLSMASPWSTGSRALGISSDGLVAVGVSGPDYWQGCRWTSESGLELLGGLGGAWPYSPACDTSTDGRVVVGYSNSTNNDRVDRFEGYYWSMDDGMVALGDLPGGAFHSRALAVSASGACIVGGSSTNLKGGGAFIWDAHHGMRQLYSVLTEDVGLDLSGWYIYEATGISDDGTAICGNGVNPRGEAEAWVAHLSVCTADLNQDGQVNSQDFFDFLAAFFTTPVCADCPDAPCRADFNRDCAVTSSDFFDFLAAFFAGCE